MSELNEFLINHVSCSWAQFLFDVMLNTFGSPQTFFILDCANDTDVYTWQFYAEMIVLFTMKIN